MTKSIKTIWLEEFLNNGGCSLCGNSGRIDTTGVKLPNGVLVGKQNYCICPNGRAIKRVNTKKGN